MEKQFDFIGLDTETIVFPVDNVWANIKIQKVIVCFTGIHDVQQQYCFCPIVNTFY